MGSLSELKRKVGGIFLPFLIVTLVLGLVGSASATPVTFDVDGPSDSYVGFTDYTEGVSITLFGQTLTFADDSTLTVTLANLASVPNFTLGDNESTTIDFFTFHVEGTGVGTFSLEANLNFDTPDLDASNTGSGGWGTYTVPWWAGGGTYSGGIFSWDNAVQDFLLADGNTVRIAMEDGFAIGAGADAIVHATITNNGGGAAPVPEPSTILLMGIGLLGLVGYSRKRSKKS